MTIVQRPLVRSRRTGGRRASENFASAIFLMPALAVFVVLFAIPLGRTVYLSFTNANGLNPDPKWVGVANYAKVFSDPSLVAGLSFTLLYTVVTSVMITVLAIPLAVVLNKRFVGRAFARSLLFFVGVPAMAIIGLIWQYIFSPLKSGALNVVLGHIGIGPIPWLADSALARFCVIFVAIWAQVGWYATLYLAYLQSIPADLYEQAEIDGANGRQQFWAITLPALVPALVVSSFLLVTNGLKVYDLPFVLTGGGPGYATNTITQQIILKGLSQFNLGLGSALATVFTVMCLIVVLLQLLAANALSRRFG